MSTRSQKVYESPLAPEIAQEILNIPVDPTDSLEHPRTIGDAVRGWASIIDKTNEHLRQSPLSGIVARSLAQDLRKRGDACIVVRYDGVVVLRITYADEEEVEPVTRRLDAPSVLKVNHSEVPLMETLRQEADSLGVDITHMGRQRKAIHEYLQTCRKNGAQRASH